ncbi:MAG: hypothetical protein IJF07_04685, partial [Lachnospiraceae bacterium]|nr:hypothetical protein [Lachnospiraceae bacterium]
MPDIQPGTYNEALILSRCYELSKYAVSITPEMLEDMYHFLCQDSENEISLSDGIIHYIDAFGRSSNVYTVNTMGSFDRIVLSSRLFRVYGAAKSHSYGNNYYGNPSYDNDYSGYSGFSSNNNNN